jgi:hypothetical protein
MLNDLRNLLGRREGGPVGFRIAASGEPLARDTAVELRWKGFGFDAKREPLEVGRRSWGGEAVKHSSKVSVETLEEKSPHPNLKAGNGVFSGCLSCCLKDRVLVE